MQIIEIIDRVQRIYNQGTPSDNSRLRPRHIYNIFKSKAAAAIEIESEKDYYLDDMEYTFIPCVKIIEVNASECDCVKIPGCSFYRTECKIPKIVKHKNKLAIKEVSTIDGSITFNMSSWSVIRESASLKYTGKDPKYFIRGEYIYFTNIKTDNTFIKYASFMVKTVDPVQALIDCACVDENSTEEKECLNAFEVDYPLGGKLYEMAIKETIEEVMLHYETTEDITSNARDGKTFY